jgi:hypothetical protein
MVKSLPHLGVHPECQKNTSVRSMTVHYPGLEPVDVSMLIAFGTLSMHMLPFFGVLLRQLRRCQDLSLASCMEMVGPVA